ncbi:hypothetical protein [Mangrovicoccus ximenensis]|uniref:hypothetical protein n=1 Tax=Mangrovicoccus ximenensis TaxID=1911570 RepID=UPI0011AE2F19|nr:hypothetical protein [Mangrovicoccus ximenensis]
MQKSANDLFPLLVDNPAFGTEGRMWSIDGPDLAEVDKVTALASLQGATANHYVPKSQEAKFAGEYAERGFSNDRWDQFMGGQQCLSICSKYLAEFELPDQYRLHLIGPETPARILDALEETAVASGVLPPMSPVLFGQRRKAVYFCLEAPDGGVAACAGACLRNHPDSRFGKTSWWGMLATREQDRGQNLSLFLGALAACKIHEAFGVEEFYTGVRSDNYVSRHICQKLGVCDSEYACLAILDPAAFGEGGYTK